MFNYKDFFMFRSSSCSTFRAVCRWWRVSDVKGGVRPVVF